MKLVELFEDRETSWGLFAVYHPKSNHRSRQFGLDWDTVKSSMEGSQTMSKEWFNRILNGMRNLGWNIIPVETNDFYIMDSHND